MHLLLWTVESEADGGLQYVQDLAGEFARQNPGMTIEVVRKDPAVLVKDVETAGLVGGAPDLLWARSEHTGPLRAANLIRPVGELFDMSLYIPSAAPDGQVWGVPVSAGNHLMLIYNTELVPEAPDDTDEMIQAARAVTRSGFYGLVYDQTAPLWLVPWYYGFGGVFFAPDSVTPVLHNEAMQQALQFLKDLKDVERIVPPESNGQWADRVFAEGRAGMIINGEWSLAGYREALGERVAAAPLPRISANGQYPRPLISGVYFMLPQGLTEEKITAIRRFVRFATSKENQLEMITRLSRLPGLRAAYEPEAMASVGLADDPLLAGAAEALEHGMPLTAAGDLQSILTALEPEMQAVLANQKQPLRAAADAQSAVEAGMRRSSDRAPLE